MTDSAETTTQQQRYEQRDALDLDKLFEFLRQHADTADKLDECAEVMRRLAIQTSYNQLFDPFRSSETLELLRTHELGGVLARMLAREHTSLTAKLDAGVPVSELPYHAAYYCLQAVIRLSNIDDAFCEAFVDADGVPVLFAFLTDSDLAALADPQPFTAQTYYSDQSYFSGNVLNMSLGSMLNLAKVYKSTKAKWRKTDLGLMAKLQELSDSFKVVGEFKLASYMIMASILDDGEVSQLPRLVEVISEIANLVGQIADSLEADTPVRIAINTGSRDHTQMSQVAIVRTNSSVVLHLSELLDAVYNMAVDDEVKFDVYGKHRVGEILRRIIFKGNEAEVDCSVKTLWQLCFDERVAEVVRKDVELIRRFEFFRDKATEVALRKRCEGILWKLMPQRKTEMVQSKGDYSHVMISYNRKSRDLCLRIKTELEALGYKVWIDVESIHGSSLQAMAAAIENSSCVLVCTSEEYKQSNNCRLEAEYMMKRNKPFIPLIMQKGYDPDGWLHQIPKA